MYKIAHGFTEASFNITPYTHNFTAQANQIFTVLSGGTWSVAGRPQRRNSNKFLEQKCSRVVD